MPSLSAPSYRDRQWAERFDGPTEDVNVFIDGLNRRHLSHGVVPYIAPIHGGLNARVLGLLSSPPDNVTGVGGTKMLSVENDDDAARFVAEQLKSSGIAYADYLPWNAYPWPLGNGRADLTQDQVHLADLTVVSRTLDPEHHSSSLLDSRSRANDAARSTYHRRLSGSSVAV